MAARPSLKPPATEGKYSVRIAFCNRLLLLLSYFGKVKATRLVCLQVPLRRDDLRQRRGLAGCG